MRPDPLMLICQKWKDPEFNPKSEAFPDLHVDFKDPIDLSYSIVKKMVITPDKAKDKFYRLKNDLIAVKARWELSGMGLKDPRVSGNDVPPRNLENDYDQSDHKDLKDGINDQYNLKDGINDQYNLKDGSNDQSDLKDGSKKAHFIAGYNPAVLYLWEMCDKNEILSEVCQQLNLENSYDSMDTTSYRSSVQKRKRVESPGSTNFSQNSIIQANNETTKVLNRSNELYQQHAEINTNLYKSYNTNNVINLGNVVLNCQDKIHNLRMLLVDTEKGSIKEELINNRIKELTNTITQYNNHLHDLQHYSE